ncbi:MAG: hypothetical protein M1817_000804 [Caeruleum heppii]|nr:MAG: hypothetical protein M1817_000804 [Caeruleum heppii]
MASVTKRKWDEEWDKVLSVPDHEADKYAPVTGRPQRTRKVPERFGGSEDAAPLRHRRQSSSAKSSSQKPKSANDRSVSTPKTGETKLSLDHPGSTPKQSLSLLTEPTSTPGNSGPATEHDTLFTEEKILSPEKPETEQEQFFSFPTEPTSHHYSALTAGDPVSQRTGPTLPLQRTGPLEEQSLTHTSQPSSLLPASRKHAYSPERTPSPPLSSLSSDRQLVKTIAHSNSLQAASAGSNKRQRTERHRLEPADQLSYSHQLESEVTTTAALTDAAAMAQPSTNDIPPGEVPGVFVAAAAPHAKLTFEEANMRSHPSPGDELVLAVTAAQNAGMIRKSYDSVSVRNVDGRFMVPVKCQFCFEPPEGRMMTNARTEAVFAFEDQRLPQAQKKKKERMGRQALCETLPYYRSYQSGPYCHGGLCYGSLLDGEGGERDYMDGDIVITRV